MTSWYYLKDKVTLGPFRPNALLTRHQEGEIADSTLVRSDHLTDWKPFVEYRMQVEKEADEASMTTAVIPGSVAKEPTNSQEESASMTTADDGGNEEAHQRYAAACAVVPVFLGIVSGIIRFPEGEGFMVWLKTFGVLLLPIALMAFVRFVLPFRIARIFGVLFIVILILIWAVFFLGILSFFF